MEKKPSKTKWVRIRNEIKKRPLLAFKLGINISQLDNYMNGIYPTDREVEEYDLILIKDRTEKCERLRVELSKMVGYRETVQFSEKVDISSTVLDNLIKKKGPLPGYEAILKFEVYLNNLMGYKISIENIHLAEKLIPEKFNDISNELFEVGKNLQGYSSTFRRLQYLIKNEKQVKLSSMEIYEINNSKDLLQRQINKLNEILKQADFLTETYIKQSL